jgi:hypothetical protein
MMLQASAIERLLTQVLRSRRWRAGRWLARLLGRYSRSASAETHHTRLRDDLEGLAGERRDLAARVAECAEESPAGEPHDTTL